MKRKTFEAPLTMLGQNQVYVFFGNTVGRLDYIAGPKRHGAQWGRAAGLSGNGRTYAIYAYLFENHETFLKDRKNIPTEAIKNQIGLFCRFAVNNPEKEFYVDFPDVIEMLSSYTRKQIAEMFNDFPLPKNIVFSTALNEHII